MAIMLFINPLYLYTVANLTKTQVGFYLLTIPITIIIASPILSHLIIKFNYRIILLYGLITYTLAAILSMLFPIQLDNSIIIITYILFGLGWAIFNTTAPIAITKSVDPNQLTISIGWLYSFFNIGAAVVLPISLILFHSKMIAELTRTLRLLIVPLTNLQQDSIHKMVKQPSLVYTMAKQLSIPSEKVLALFKSAFMIGMSDMFWVILILGVLAYLSIYKFLKVKN